MRNLTSLKKILQLAEQGIGGEREKEMDLFFKAFIHTNNIFPPSDCINKRDMTDQELQELRKMVKMMNAIDNVQIRKALPERRW